jgi:DNA mismatch repair protein MutL
VLGQAQDLFILAEGGGQLWIIDQHVAHERVLFDRLTRDSREGGDVAEALLVPVALELGPRQALAVAEHREQLAELGFQLEPFGPNRVQARAVPRSLLGRRYEQALRDMIDELTELSQGGQVRLRGEQLAAAAAGRACKAAVKAGMPLTREEMERLLADLAGTAHPYTCPHGRPVFLTYEQAEVVELFGGRRCD